MRGGLPVGSTRYGSDDPRVRRHEDIPAKLNNARVAERHTQQVQTLWPSGLRVQVSPCVPDKKEYMKRSKDEKPGL